MVVESEPDALHMIPVVPAPSIAVAAHALEGQEERLDSTVIKEGDPVQDHSSSSKSFVDTEVQPEAQVLEETFNIVKADSGVATVNIQPEDLPSTVTSSYSL